MTVTMRVAAALLAVALVGGCATSGQKFSDAPTAAASPVAKQDPALGRIYFYRTMLLGAAVQPVVTVNGEIVGRATPNGFFYVDRKPGTYEIAATTEVENKLSVPLDKGQVRYVKLNLSMGFVVGRVVPELMEPGFAAKDMADTRYTGN